MCEPKIIRSKRKSIALIVERDGTVVVRAPMRMSRAAINEFIRQHEGWIREKQELVKRLPGLPVKKKFTVGEEFLFLGRAYPLRIVNSQTKPLVLGDSFCLSRSVLKRGEEVFIGWYRFHARQYLSGRAVELARRYGYAYKSVRISSARTRWGSCSAKGNLSFPWRLIMAPPDVIDYVVVHELVHLGIKNHSKDFWKRVEELMPDYREKRGWLKKNGEMLSLDGK